MNQAETGEVQRFYTPLGLQQEVHQPSMRHTWVNEFEDGEYVDEDVRHADSA